MALFLHKMILSMLNSLILFPFALFKVLILTINSLKILKKEKISYLISTGGYMSLPLCLAAKILNIKIFLIEPNMVLGREIGRASCRERV